ncbi:aminopeptidase N [Phocaeicola sartorii]|uniref:Aminopeptidase N n=1 Tax=Phocaeicola sartorii TaxID=671267 RepID=R9ICI2_9BACT|nr:aminopeptidase N [Phocaeicola sartorii]
MKTYIGNLILMCCLLCSCHQPTNNPHLYDKGVSQELAALRKQEIKELKYKLYFAIPEQKSVPVNGKITIEFNLDMPQEIILDFREESEKIKSVSVNGQTSHYDFRNEHIILPKNNIIKGKNDITIQFIAGNQSLNRNDEFLYTLLVPDRARTLFPCFEQPNLKATFTLQLDVPTEWKAVSNTYITKEEIKSTGKTVTFAPTEPLSTYLFSFVAGKLEQKEYTEGDRKISAYYRETDPDKVAQLDTIFKQVAASLNWLEEYTDVPYPFAKYDFIILPGFQYGGMEHTGATLYNDTQMFLSNNPTPDEELRRTQLIAHETAHMWFGDLVTMNWFDDVWTKEVFANYFAALITEPLFPQINHQLNWMKTYTAASLSEDRTPGTTAIRQPLDNLQNAGLIYGQIIYNKAPVMMVKLVELMGKEAFREGIQEYLKTYAYANATWDDLIQILDSKTEQDLSAFSDAWVNQKGMPVINFERSGNQLTIRQQDPYQRGLNWPQKFNITLCGERDTTIEANLTNSQYHLTLPFTPTHILPNTDGRGYGLLVPAATVSIGCWSTGKK